MVYAVKVLGLLIAALSLTACSVILDPAPPYSLKFDDAMTFEQKFAIIEAAESWNEALGHEAFYVDGFEDRDGCNQLFVSIAPEGTPIAHGREALVGQASTDKCNYRVRLTTKGLADHTTVQHELGHTLGLPDVDTEEEQDSVMFWTPTSWPTYITPRNVSDVLALWNW